MGQAALARHEDELSLDATEIIEARARYAGLEADLDLEKRRGAQKDAEIKEMSKLLSALEATIEQQAKVSQLDQENLLKLEEAHRQALEDMQGDRQWTDGDSAKRDQSEQVSNLKAVADKETRRAELAEISARDLQVKVETLEKQLAEEEEAREMSEASIAYKDNQIKDLTQHVSMVEEKCKEMSKKAQEQEQQLLTLRKQLAEELSKRQALLVQVQEKNEEVKRLAETLDSSGTVNQRAIDIERDREKCSLQQEIAEELRKRQELQSLVIEKEREICQLKEREFLDLRRGLSSHSKQASEDFSREYTPMSVDVIRENTPIDSLSSTSDQAEAGTFMPATRMTNVNIVRGGRRVSSIHSLNAPANGADPHGKRRYSSQLTAVTALGGPPQVKDDGRRGPDSSRYSAESARHIAMTFAAQHSVNRQGALTFCEGDTRTPNSAPGTVSFHAYPGTFQSPQRAPTQQHASYGPGQIANGHSRTGSKVMDSPHTTQDCRIQRRMFLGTRSFT